MKHLKIIFAILISLAFSCKKNNDTSKLSGIVKAQGITTYQYGTHVLSNNLGKTLYVLRSNSINLDDYINKKVEISGKKVDGYPVDGGPDYIDVLKIK